MHEGPAQATKRPSTDPKPVLARVWPANAICRPLLMDSCGFVDLARVPAGEGSFGRNERWWWVGCRWTSRGVQVACVHDGTGTRETKTRKRARAARECRVQSASDAVSARQRSSNRCKEVPSSAVQSDPGQSSARRAQDTGQDRTGQGQAALHASKVSGAFLGRGRRTGRIIHVGCRSAKRLPLSGAS